MPCPVSQVAALEAQHTALTDELAAANGQVGGQGGLGLGND